MSPVHVFGTVAFLGLIALWGELVLEAFALTCGAKLLQTATIAWAVKVWSDRSEGLARTYARWLALGLAFSLSGDFFLMGILDRGSRWVLALGVLSFAFTQVFYLIALRRVGTRPARLAIILFAAVFFLLAIANHWTLRLPLDLALGSGIYSILLGAMACHATAGLRNQHLPIESRRAAALGAWLFVVTDALLPVVLFGEGVGIAIPQLGFWVYQTYIISQCFFALSAFGLKSTEA
jgi:hypothetical protein